jgi:hypothetical protein
VLEGSALGAQRTAPPIREWVGARRRGWPHPGAAHTAGSVCAHRGTKRTAARCLRERHTQCGEGLIVGNALRWQCMRVAVQDSRHSHRETSADIDGRFGQFFKDQSRAADFVNARWSSTCQLSVVVESLECRESSGTRKSNLVFKHCSLYIAPTRVNKTQLARPDLVTYFITVPRAGHTPRIFVGCCSILVL